VDEPIGKTSKEQRSKEIWENEAEGKHQEIELSGENTMMQWIHSLTTHVVVSVTTSLH
jgi:hypothetical protein